MLVGAAFPKPLMRITPRGRTSLPSFTPPFPPMNTKAQGRATLTAFYTPPVVISAIYKAMEQMGLREGNILEPSCGIGNFIGMLPTSMQNSKIYGVEIDKISAGIAQQLYQKTSIAAQPFEEANIPDSFLTQ